MEASDHNRLLVKLARLYDEDQPTQREIAERVRLSRQKLVRHGAVGDMNFRYFDGHGQPLTSDLDAQTIGLNLDEIKQTGHVVGVAGGFAKYKATRGALAGRFLDVLVTDHNAARQLLRAKDQQAAGGNLGAKA